MSKSFSRASGNDAEIALVQGQLKHWSDRGVEMEGLPSLIPFLLELNGLIKSGFSGQVTLHVNREGKVGKLQTLTSSSADLVERKWKLIEGGAE